MKKRLFALLTALALCLSLLPTAALADETPKVTLCGTQLTSGNYYYVDSNDLKDSGSEPDSDTATDYIRFTLDDDNNAVITVYGSPIFTYSSGIQGFSLYSSVPLVIKGESAAGSKITLSDTRRLGAGLISAPSVTFEDLAEVNLNANNFNTITKIHDTDSASVTLKNVASATFVTKESSSDVLNLGTGTLELKNSTLSMQNAGGGSLVGEDVTYTLDKDSTLIELAAGGTPTTYYIGGDDEDCQYAYGGDVSTTGLSLSTLPTGNTIYKAGDHGTILFTPASGGDNAKFTLNNAIIDVPGDSAIFFNDLGENIDIELIGNNSLEGTSGLSFNDFKGKTLTIGGSGTLMLDGTGDALSTATKGNLVLTDSVLVNIWDGDVNIGKNLTIGSGTALTLRDSCALSVGGKITNNGALLFGENYAVNRTDITADSAAAASYIKTLKLNGSGYVQVGVDGPKTEAAFYKNNGTVLPTLALSTSPLKGTGYSWNGSTLTLKNVSIGRIKLPSDDADVTIKIDGTVTVVDIYGESYTGALTITGNGTGKSNLTVPGYYSEGGSTGGGISFASASSKTLTIESLTVTVGGIGIAGATKPEGNLVIRNAIAIASNINWTDEGEHSDYYGIYLENSKLTVGKNNKNSAIFSGIIVMDNSSELTLNGGYIGNHGHCGTTGLDSLSLLLPPSYSIGSYGESITILDPLGNPATDLTLGSYNSDGTEIIPGGSPGSSPSGTTHYVITASAGKGGSISPSGSVHVRRGGDKTFTITPEEGYVIASVTVDSVAVGAVTSYTFKEVYTSHTIEAVFTASNVPAGLNGIDHTAYVAGYPDDTVRPNDSITRAEAATMLYRLLTDARRGEIETEQHSFTDIAPTAWYRTAVATMANGGYLNGYEDGTFGGNKSITRAEFVAMLVRFIGLRDAQCSFTDVSTDFWAYAYIATATDAGWIDGYTDDTFRPNDSITRAEAMTVLNRVLNRGVDKSSELLNCKVFKDVSSSAWYYYEVIEASNGHDYTGARPSENWTKLK